MSDDLIGLLQSIDWQNIPKPIWRLIETTWRGIGKAGMMFLLGERGRGEAQKLDAIATAMQRHSSAPLSLSYKDETLTIKTLDAQQQVPVPLGTVDQRTQERVAFQHQQEQLRIENILAHSGEELISETEVPTEEPSDDFVARFFDYAKTISTEEMQRLWGKILKGEIKRPGTFSLRTLDIVRNISQQESELFVRVCQYALYAKSDVFVPLDVGKLSGNKLVYRHLALLAEIGLLQGTTSAIYPFRDGKTNIVFAFSNDVAVSAVRDPNTSFRSEPGLNVWPLTNAARQLANLFSWESPPGYVEAFCKEVKKLGWIPTIGTYTNPEAPEFHENPQGQEEPRESS